MADTVLSIGKLGLGHWAYYEQSVADGREDYYAGAGEEQGSYIGRGASALDLTGEVADGDLKHLFRGTHPTRPGRWLDRQRQDKVKPTIIKLPDGREIVGQVPVATAAFDLTFSAPKSVSVLWALSDDPAAKQIKQAHEAAVAQTFDYLERTACVTRRGRGGSTHLRGEGFIGAAYNHRSSRAGDPQLHTHVLVANATNAEGRYTALHGALLFREAKTASYLYQAALRNELSQRLGIEWHRDPSSPHPEIVGVDRLLRDQFSKRADEIAEHLAYTGKAGHRAATAAALDTRASKDYEVDGLELKHRWRDEAAQLDTPDPRHAIARAVHTNITEAAASRAAGDIADTAFTPDGLTSNRSTFDRRDVLQLAANNALQGATVAQIEQIADLALDHAGDRIVLLEGGEAPRPTAPASRADGTKLADARTDRPFTTRELLEHEQLILDSMRARKDEGAAVVPSKRSTSLLDARPEGHQLAPEQRAMVESITTSGHGMQVVVGLAGSGKTFSFEAAHDIWRDTGVEVRGCSTALTAAKNLEAETGIQSETVARIKHWAERAAETGDTSQLDAAIPRNGVLVVDEAGMVATRDLSFLADQAHQRDTKIVLVGDHRQLPEIGAGGAFAGLVHRFDGTDHVDMLLDNRRQRESWERDALAELREGQVDKSIAHYVANDRITTSPSPEDLRTQLANDWLEAREHNPQVAMIAYTNRDVDALNTHVRNTLDERGDLGNVRLTAAGKEWAAGDELVCLRNNRALGLANGTRGTVTDVSNKGLTIRTTNGDAQLIPRDYLERGHATYGWATTGHKAQGLTINGEAFVLASEHVSREWMYVAMSRAKDSSRIYIDTIDRDPRTGRQLSTAEQYEAAVVELHHLASRSSAQQLAHERGPETERLSLRDMQRISQRDDLPQQEREQLALSQQQRSEQLQAKLVQQPPSYLLPLIGPAPLDERQRQTWARDAVRLEEHRRRRGLAPTDMNTARASRVLGRDLSRGHERGRGIGR